jgi:glutathione peroxidase
MSAGTEEYKIMNALRRRLRTLTVEHPMGNAHDFSFHKLNGAGEINLNDCDGKALLVVNVASKCGFTPQYRELQALWDAKRNAGLIVLGVPSNDFGGQEKGSEEDIAQFCEASYHVTFPMTGKVEIVGARRHPFYQWIASELGPDGLPRWNFHKYLVGKDGGLEGSFPSRAAPLGAEILTAVEKALAS